MKRFIFVLLAAVGAWAQTTCVNCPGSSGAGTPGGSTTQVQYNDASAFAGDSTFTFNKTTKALTVQSVNTSGSGTNQIDEGSASGTTPGINIIHGGDAAANAEPGYLGLGTSPTDTLIHNLFGTSVATCLAISDSAPGADSSNCILQHSFTAAQNMVWTMGNFTMSRTFGAATGAGTAMATTTDTASNTGTGFVGSYNTAASSAAKVFRLAYQGTSNGVQMANSAFLTTLGTGGIDSAMLHCDSSSTTKCMTFTLSGITAGQTRAVTIPDAASTTVVADTGASNNFLTAISAAGAISKAQPSFSNLSGSVAAAQLPNPSATTLGGIESYAAVSNQWINAISTSGVPSSTQPAFSNLSGSATGAQLPATAVQTNQANTYTTGAQSFAAATSLLLPAGNTNPTADGSVYYNNSAQTPGTGEHLGGSAISQFVPFLRVVCPTTLTDVTVSTILNPAATTETVFDVNCKINSLHLTAGKTLLVFAELQVVAPGASASTQDFRLKICQVSGCASGTVVNLYDPSSTDSAIAINTTRSVGVMFIVRCDTTGTSGTLDVGLLSKAGSASSGAANSVTQPVTVATNVDEYLSMSYASGNATTGNTAQLRQFWVAEMN